MGMAGPDFVLFVVGALLFAGASFAIVQTEGGLDAIGGGGSALGVYAVTWTATSLEDASEPVADFSDAQASFDVNGTNLAKVTVVIDCNDPVVGPAAFSLQVQVTPPAGVAPPEPVTGACGSAITIPVDISSAPPETTVQGGSEAEARSNIPATETSTLGSGAWSVMVTGARGGTLPGLPAGNPGGSITLQAEAWTPRLSAVQR